MRKYRAERTTNSGASGDNTTANSNISSSNSNGRPSNASSNDTAVTAIVVPGGGSQADLEAVRRELEEKADLLSAAYQAMEALKREREGERAELQVGNNESRGRVRNMTGFVIRVSSGRGSDRSASPKNCNRSQNFDCGIWDHLQCTGF